MIRTLLILLIAIGTPVFSTQGSDTDTITEVRLRATVRLAHDRQSLTLGDLARIEGPQADVLQTLPIKHAATLQPGIWGTLSFSTIREQLKQAAGINFGAIALSGSEIRFTRLAEPNAPRPAPKPIARQQATQPEPTLREHIERWVYARLKSTPKTTRITFNERDSALLNTPTTDRIVEIREIGRSDRMTLRIVVYEGERIVSEQQLRFEALIEREVLVSTVFIRRDERVSAESTRLEKRWLPTTVPIAPPSESLGQVARTTIDPGEMLLASMLESPILVERGQMVSARSVAGSVSVSLKVRAKQDGRMGEIIELESRDRTQRFHARVAGAGRVVIVHDPDQNTANAPANGRS